MSVVDARAATGSTPSPGPAAATVLVEVEQALGPGVDFEHDSQRGLVARRARSGGVWLGFDRAALVDSDDGHGRDVPVLVAVPASTFAGCQMDVELVGGLATASATVLVAAIPGWRGPSLALAQVAAGLGAEATAISRDEADKVVLRAHQRFRERRGHERIVGGRAWHSAGSLPPELARYATPHSAAEYSLTRMPLQFMRGLEGMLDDDERLLYWVERPALTEVGLLDRVRGRIDRRAALLALTDRQLLWVVDHAQPDRYLSDWGVDIETIPVERLEIVTSHEHAGSVELAVRTRAGPRHFRLPAEVADEVAVMVALAARFTPRAGNRLPRRLYPVEPMPFDPEPAARFGQESEARSLFEEATQAGDVLAFLYSPRRPGHRHSSALVLRPEAMEVVGTEPPRSVALTAVISLRCTLSPLVGHIAADPGPSIAYPAPLQATGATLLRLARRILSSA